MKFIVIIGDGMSDRPLEELNGLTPLQKASTPNMDLLARKGIVGKAKTIPVGFQPGSDVANLSILGYNPEEFYTGRAPLEAASMGISLKSNDVAYRCNLVTLQFNDRWTESVMEDYSAGHISTKEAHVLIRDINRELGTDTIQFYPGISYRHLMIWTDGHSSVQCTPPHDIIGENIGTYLPKENNSSQLVRLMEASVKVLRDHSVNQKRIQGGKRPGNAIWLWGQGGKPSIPTFKEKYNISGALISAVDLTKGLGTYAGFEIVDVPGITGYIDTNYTGKAEYALKALENNDFVYIHIEAPDEAGHSGNIKDKIKAIEDIDSLIVGPVVRGAEKKFKDFRILLMPDHATPISVRTHTDDSVPFAIYDSTLEQSSDFERYNEIICEQENILTFEEGHTLMHYFLSSKKRGSSRSSAKEKH